VDNREHRVRIAFEPMQIKAVGNTTTFNPHDASIYKPLERLTGGRIRCLFQ